VVYYIRFTTSHHEADIELDVAAVHGIAQLDYTMCGLATDEYPHREVPGPVTCQLCIDEITVIRKLKITKGRR